MWRRRDQSVVLKRKSLETFLDRCNRHVLSRAVGFASRVPHWISSREQQIVGKYKIVHALGSDDVTHKHHVGRGIRKRCDVIDSYVVKRILRPTVRDNEYRATAHVIRAEIVQNQVVNAPARTRQCSASVLAIA